jgi:hypothetical protein
MRRRKKQCIWKAKVVSSLLTLGETTGRDNLADTLDGDEDALDVGGELLSVAQRGVGDVEVAQGNADVVEGVDVDADGDERLLDLGDRLGADCALGQGVYLYVLVSYCYFFLVRKIDFLRSETD